MRLLAMLAFLMLVAPAGWGQGLAKADLTIVTASGQHYRFDVEVARSEAEQERGLMFRTAMAADAGMIFPQDRDKTMSFWMKNTYIPLDIIFITADGRISHIKPDATPRSEDVLPSGGPIRAVLELNGGTCARLGIHVGDKVVFPGLGG